MRLAGVLKHSSVNGPGVRYVIFTQGCPHHCPGCQNPETHDPLGGQEVPVETVISELLSTRYLDGVTLSGGDPLMQPEASLEILRAAKAHGLGTWVYTGYRFEDVKALPLMQYVDVLVDGPFVAEERKGEPLYRGSLNQRLVDVKASLEAGHVVEAVC